MQEKGFFAALLDFRFTESIALRIIPILYVAGCVMGVLSGLTILVGGLMSHSALGGMVSVVLGPLVAILYILGIRIALEVTMAILRIAENTKELAAQGRTRSEGQAPQL